MYVLIQVTYKSMRGIFNVFFKCSIVNYEHYLFLKIVCYLFVILLFNSLFVMVYLLLINPFKLEVLASVIKGSKFCQKVKCNTTTQLFQPYSVDAIEPSCSLQTNGLYKGAIILWKYISSC